MLNKTKLLIYILFFSTIYSQPDRLWSKTYRSDIDMWGTDVEQISDSGFILVSPEYMIKTNADGDSLWTLLIGDGQGWGSIEQSSDGGYIVTTGILRNNVTDISIQKVNAIGDTIWTKVIGGTGRDYGYNLKKTNDGGYVIVGSTKSFGSGDQKIWLIKLDSSGDTTWTRTYSGVNWAWGIGLLQTSDNGYLIAGSRNDNSDTFGWIIKTNSQGDTLWTSKISGSCNGYNDVELFSIIETSENNFVSSGIIGKCGLIVKINSSGNEIWRKSTGGRRLGSIIENSKGDYIACGYDYTGSKYVGYIVYSDKNGNVKWEKQYPESDMFHSIKNTYVGGIILAGNYSIVGNGNGLTQLTRIDKDSPPTIPSNLVLLSVGDKKITLKWNKNTENDFYKYYIYGDTLTNPITRVDSASSINDTVKTITGLTNGITYYYRISAMDNAGNESGYSNEISAVPSGFNNDSLAVVMLYDSLDGTNWTSTTNWRTTQPLSSWYGITVVNNLVTRIDLGDNKLAGQIPAAIGDLDNLNYLNFQNNQLTGILPTAIGNLVSLDTLNLYNNQIGGTIPVEIGNLAELKYLDLSASFTGSIPAERGYPLFCVNGISQSV